MLYSSLGVYGNTTCSLTFFGEDGSRLVGRMLPRFKKVRTWPTCVTGRCALEYMAFLYALIVCLADEHDAPERRYHILPFRRGP